MGACEVQFYEWLLRARSSTNYLFFEMSFVKSEGQVCRRTELGKKGKGRRKEDKRFEQEQDRSSEEWGTLQAGTWKVSKQGGRGRATQNRVLRWARLCTEEARPVHPFPGRHSDPIPSPSRGRGPSPGTVGTEHHRLARPQQPHLVAGHAP